ncbi:MAG: FHA domain-containing protein [Phycisphaerae bacterium]|nr:FHA domain-containing protein [Phycisphaerae bacterium]
MLVLTVIQGPDKDKVYELPDHQPQLVGRSSEALPITDTTVSRRHAELTPDDGEWYIRDLQSQNGTYVNGVRISGRTPLRLGDQIRTGATLFVFGRASAEDERNRIRLLRPDQLDASVERVMPSNEDSIVLAEPEPRQAAAEHLRVVYRLVQLTSQLTDRPALLRSVMDLVFNEFRPERGFIVLTPDAQHADEIAPVVVRHRDARARAKEGDEERLGVSRTILQLALRKGEGVLSSNAMNDPRFTKGDSVHLLHIRSAICSPIRFREHTYGAIYIDSSIANYTFTAEQLALMNAIGQHTGLALANADLYVEKLRGERLAAIGETVASLSHSIKNILQGLRGGADVVEMGLKKDDLKVARGGWSILKRNLDRIIGLTMNMLAYSRPRTLEVELTKIGSLLNDCAELLHDQCVNRQVALIVDAESEMPPLSVDPGQVHQAFMNLMANAVEAVDARTGTVTVRATYHAADPRRGRTHAELHVDVIDNGPGIAPEAMPRLFEPFFSTKGTRGTGLGLTVTKRIIEQHGGRIKVESAPGRGATFTVILPADLTPGVDPSETAQSRQHHAEGERRF